MTNRASCLRHQVKKQKCFHRDASSSFAKPSKQIYHHISESSSLCTFPHFASAAACEDLIELCEQEGFNEEKEKHKYPQATFDLEVDSSPRVREWLERHDLVPAVSCCMKSSHLTSPVSFDDVFVVKYDATVPNGQQSLGWHCDAGDVSFMLALSSPDDYSGGGTQFDVLKEGYNEFTQQQALEGMPETGLFSFFSSGHSPPALHLQQGELLVFDAKLYHSGKEISSGMRYLLVGFCVTDASGDVHRGEVGLDLLPLHTA